MSANKYSIWHALELAIRLAVRANEEVRILASRSIAGPKGDPGERGPDGQPGTPGKLPIARAWAEGVHYEGSAVTHVGATWQALRDTGHEPPHDDWICLALPGVPGESGKSSKVCGTYDSSRQYSELNIVAVNGATFIAKVNNPGPCPGNDWQLMSAVGKRGEKGDRGEQGMRGNPGLPGPGVKSLVVDGDGLLTVINGDGSIVTCDLYPVLAKIR